MPRATNFMALTWLFFLLAFLVLPGVEASGEDEDKVPQQLTLDQLNPQAWSDIGQHFTLSDFAQLAATSKSLLPAVFDPRSAERMDIRQHCDPILADRWLRAVFRRRSPRAPEREDNVQFLSLDTLRSAFFHASCLGALSSFCRLAALPSAVGTHPPLSRLQLNVGQLTGEEADLLRRHYSHCRTEFTLQMSAGFGSLSELEALLADRQLPFHFHVHTPEDMFLVDAAGFLARLLDSGVTSIRALTLYRLNTPHGLQHVLKAMQRNPSVQSLKIELVYGVHEHVSVLVDALAQGLRVHTLSLESIDLRGSIADQFWSALATNSHVHTLDIALTFLPLHLHARAFQAYLVWPDCPLRVLRLRPFQLDSESGLTIAKALSRNRSLMQLSLSNGSMDVESLVELADSIKRHPNLRTFALANNRVHSESIAAFGNLLRANRLQEFALYTITREPLSFVSFMDGVRDSSTLTKLHLRGTTLDANSVLRLADALRDPENKLELLRLQGAQLESGSIVQLVTAVEQNDRLLELDLSGNRIDDDAAIGSLAQMLARSTALQTLVLGKSELSYHAAAGMMDALASNPQSALRVLDLNGNQIGSTYPQATVPSFHRPTNLSALRLYHNRFTGPSLLYLTQQLQAHPHLRDLYLGLEFLPPGVLHQIRRHMHAHNTEVHYIR